MIFGLMVAAAGVSALKPWPLAVLVDSVLGSQPAPAWLRHLLPSTPGASAAGTAGLIGALVAAILGLHATQAALAALYNDLAIGVGLRGLERVRCDLFDKLLRLSQRFCHQTPAGDLIQRQPATPARTVSSPTWRRVTTHPSVKARGD